MNDIPPPPPSSTPTGRGVRIQDPVALFLAALGIALAAGVVVGVVVGVTVGAAVNADCSPTDSWCELGGVIYGFLGGIVAGLTTYVVAGVATIRRCRPRGRRAGHVVAHLLATVVIPTLFGAITSIAP